MSSFDLDDFDNPPPPPRYLFKYLSVARVANVLEQGIVRFTALLNTNDSFEVRSTFRKLAGPRFLKMLAEQMDVAVSEASVDAMIAEQLQKLGVTSRKVIRLFLEQLWLEFVPVLHRLQGRLAAQG